MGRDLVSWFTVGWIVIGVQILVLEAIAVVQRRGTLSGHVWHLLDRSTFGRMLVLMLLGWLVWHWVVEHELVPQLKRSWADDGLIGVLFLVVGFFTRRRRT